MSTSNGTSVIAERPRKRAKTSEEAVDHQCEDGDLLLVSSDGEAFKVHSYQLKAASTVFAHLLCTTSETTPIKADGEGELRRLELVDTTLEHSEPLKLLLDSIYGVRLRYSWKQDVSNYMNLIKLFDKWDCKRCREALRQTIAYDILQQPGDRSASAFLLAAHLDDVDLATQAMSQVCTVNTTSTHCRPLSVATLEDYVEDQWTLHLGAMTHDFYSAFPSSYAHALLRAGIGSTAQSGDTDWKQVADTFKKLMEKSRSRPRAPRK